MKEEKTVSQINYAGFWLRVCVYFLDIFIVKIFSIIILIVSFFTSLEGSTSLILGGASIFFFWVLLGINIYLYFTKGESIAYRLCGLRIYDVNTGNKPSAGALIGRFFAKILSAIILMFGFFMIGWSPRKQGLHDKLAGTVVVKEKPTPIIFLIIGSLIAITYLLHAIYTFSNITKTTFNGHFDKAQEAQVHGNLFMLEVLIMAEESDNWNADNRYLGGTDFYKQVLSDNEMSLNNDFDCYFIVGTAGTDTKSAGDNSYLILSRPIDKLLTAGSLDNESLKTSLELLPKEDFSCKGDFLSVISTIKQQVPSNKYQFTRIYKGQVDKLN